MASLPTCLLPGYPPIHGVSAVFGLKLPQLQAPVIMGQVLHTQLFLSEHFTSSASSRSIVMGGALTSRAAAASSPSASSASAAAGSVAPSGPKYGSSSTQLIIILCTVSVITFFPTFHVTRARTFHLLYLPLQYGILGNSVEDCICSVCCGNCARCQARAPDVTPLRCHRYRSLSLLSQIRRPPICSQEFNEVHLRLRVPVGGRVIFETLMNGQEARLLLFSRGFYFLSCLFSCSSVRPFFFGGARRGALARAEYCNETFFPVPPGYAFGGLRAATHGEGSFSSTFLSAHDP